MNTGAALWTIQARRSPFDIYTPDANAARTIAAAPASPHAVTPTTRRNDVAYRIHAQVAPAAGLGPHFGVLDTDAPELTAWLAQRLAR